MFRGIGVSIEISYTFVVCYKTSQCDSYIRTSLVHRPSAGGGKAWYTLFAHAPTFYRGARGKHHKTKWACAQNVRRSTHVSRV